jgi:3'-phosphoadenosine 5'-phosphosulfate sulfotransferase (PAPS reductase)/FAD synthetase
MNTIRAISYGGGVQSTCLLVLAARADIDFPLAIMADTGAENPATLDYLERHARPYAARHGIEIVVVRHATETLTDRVLRQKGVTIPMRNSTTGAPLLRGCTRDFKVRPIAAELKKRGATRTHPAVVAMGISWDEVGRMKPSSVPYETFDFPLIDRRMTRSDCARLIAAAGLPVPPRSACWMCPYTSRERWREMARSQPATFAQAVMFERAVNTKQLQADRPVLWLSDALRPLDEAINTDQPVLFELEASCDVAGYCAA